MVIGQKISHYRILEKLGEGGMGVVYLACDIALDRQVALKILRPEHCASAERKKRFIQEARTASSLNHPNIVGIYEVDSVDGVEFIAMEWVDGIPMDRLIRPGGLPVRDVLKHGAQVADALARAHACGIIHRDLKPGNLLVTRDGTVKVTDFGLAKLIQASESDPDADTATFHQAPPITEEGAILGTVAYMSPEQAEGKRIDTRSDVFSFGAVLYEMITGKRAFSGETRVSTIAAILTKEPAPLTDLVSDVPSELARLVMRCLRKDPERRIQHLGDARLSLTEMHDEAISGSLPKLKDAVTARWAVRRPFAVGGALLGAVLLVAAGYFLGNHRSWPSDWSADVQFDQLTDEAGEEAFPSLAPDGNSFVYAGQRSGQWHIFMRRVGGGKAIDLTPTSESDSSEPAMSPDGQSIAFRSSRDGGGIFLMGATGESVRRLTNYGFNPAWSPDGSEIVCTSFPSIRPQHRANVTSSLWIVDRRSGSRRNIDVPDALKPSWSPHGFRIAYSASDDSGKSIIWTVNPRPGLPASPLKVTDDEAVNWNPVWSPDGEWLYFASNRGGTMNLWRVKIEEESGKAEGMPEPIRLPCSYAGHFTFSRDGRRMAFAAMHFFHNIQSAAFDPEAERLVTVPGPMTPPLTGLNPHVSPDGRKLAFASTGRREAIYLAGLQGEDPQQVTDGIGKTRAPRWSPDGKSLAFYSNRSGRYEIWTIAADGGGLRQMTRAAGAGAWFPDWSPDGKQISYYAVGVGSFVLRIDASGEPGPAVPLGRPDPGVLPWSWSPDGKYVALQRTTVTDLFGGFGYCRATGGDIRLLSESGGAPEWLRDSHRLLFLDAGRLKLLDIKDSRIKDLAPATNAVERIGVTPDNRVIYFVSLRTDGDIWLAQLR